MARSASLRELEGGEVPAPSLSVSASLTSAVGDAGARSAISRVPSAATVPSDDDCSVIFHPDEEEDTEGSTHGRRQGFRCPAREQPSQSQRRSMNWAPGQAEDKSHAWDSEGGLPVEHRRGEGGGGRREWQKQPQPRQQQQQQQFIQQQPQSLVQPSAQLKRDEQQLSVQVTRPPAVMSLKMVPQTSPLGSEKASPPNARITSTAGAPMRHSPKSPSALPAILMRRSTGGTERAESPQASSPRLMPRLSTTRKWSAKDRHTNQSDTPRPFDMVVSPEQKKQQEEVIRKKEELLAFVQIKQQLSPAGM